MKFCQSHWDQLRNGLKDRGMFHLVAKSGQELFNRFKKEENNQTTVPDPLMEAHNMIIQRSLQYMPHIIMNNEHDPEGHFCALCEAVKYMPLHPETKLPCDQSWIITLLDYLKTEYTKEGWLNNN